MRDDLVPFTAGVVASLLLHAAGGWWLNSSRGVIAMTVVMFGMGVGSTLWTTEARWHRAAAVALGAVAGMSGVLFWTGPGTIWPIVLTVATLMTAAAVCAGVLAAAAIRPRR